MLEQLEKGLKNVAESAKDNAPWILAGATVIGFGVSLILAAKAGRNHERIIEDLDRDDVSTEEYNKKLKKETAKCYIPPAISAAITVLCMIGSAKLGYSQMVAMIACCTALKQQYTEYRKTNIELNGEEADKKVVTEHVQSNLCRADNIIVLPVSFVGIVEACKPVLPVHSLCRICHYVVG